jgi:hypothetical protein
MASKVQRAILRLCAQACDSASVKQNLAQTGYNPVSAQLLSSVY